MPTILGAGRPMRSSFRDRAEGLSLYAPFTHSFVNCCCSVGFPMRDEVRGRGFTIIATCSPFTAYDVGIETVRISMPNFLFWPPTWDINTFPELSAICISPPKSFLKSPHERMRPSVTSFPGESNNEAHRFFHSRHQFLDALLGRTAESQPQYDQSISRCVYSASAVLPRRARHRPGKAASRTDRCLIGGSIPGSLGDGKKIFAAYAKPSACHFARILPICSGRRTGPHGSMPENPRDSPTATRSPNSRIPFQRRTG